ncbi:unnamed protein product [Urochloa decumbens]|uniref:DUF7866 domain-containing protein n=1 Tax=Urochloa decumbens TaxID=240449 RepID=A0ABC9GNA4_9POAL
MAKVTEMFLTLAFILLYTSLCNQDAAEYDGFTAHSPVESPVAHLLATAPITYRTTCAPCRCCLGGDAACPQSPSCCLKLTCNGPNRPIGACAIQQLACNCNNCPITGL